MKYLILTILSLGYLSTFCQHNITIIGKTPSTFNGKSIELVIEDSYSLKPYTKKFKTIIRNNSFSIKGTIDKLNEWGYLNIPKYGFYYMAIDTGIMHLTINPLPKGSSTHKNLLSNISFKNSNSNLIQAEINKLDNYYPKKYGIPDSLNKNILILPTERIKELETEKLNVIKKHPTVFFSLIALNRINITLTNVNALQETFESLIEEIKTSTLGNEYQKKLLQIKSTTLGNQIWPFTIKTHTDSFISSQSLLGSSYLIIFGATWCKPCKTDYPIVQSLYDDFAKKGLKMISLNFHDDKDLWLKQIVHYKQEWIHASELVKWNESKLAKDLNVRSLPKYMLINKEGIIIYNSYQTKDPTLTTLRKIIESNL